MQENGGCASPIYKRRFQYIGPRFTDLRRKLQVHRSSEQRKVSHSSQDGNTTSKLAPRLLQTLPHVRFSFLPNTFFPASHLPLLHSLNVITLINCTSDPGIAFSTIIKIASNSIDSTSSLSFNVGFVYVLGYKCYFLIVVSSSEFLQIISFAQPFRLCATASEAGNASNNPDNRV